MHWPRQSLRMSASGGTRSWWIQARLLSAPAGATYHTLSNKFAASCPALTLCGSRRSKRGGGQHGPCRALVVVSHNGRENSRSFLNETLVLGTVGVIVYLTSGSTIGCSPCRALFYLSRLVLASCLLVARSPMAASRWSSGQRSRRILAFKHASSWVLNVLHVHGFAKEALSQ